MLICVKTGEQGEAEGKNKITQTQYALEQGEVNQVSPQSMGMTGNSPVAEIMNPRIEQHPKQQTEIENGKIAAPNRRAGLVLNHAVDAQYPKGFNQQIRQNQQYQIECKAGGYVHRFRKYNFGV